MNSIFFFKDFVFTISTYNPNFTRVEIWFRFFFVLSTSVVSFAYFYISSLRKFHLSDWSYEQKWTGNTVLIGYSDSVRGWSSL